MCFRLAQYGELCDLVALFKLPQTLYDEPFDRISIVIHRAPALSLFYLSNSALELISKGIDKSGFVFGLEDNASD